MIVTVITGLHKTAHFRYSNITGNLPGTVVGGVGGSQRTAQQLIDSYTGVKSAGQAGVGHCVDTWSI